MTTSKSSVERLSAEDALMLWPDEIWPQDIGALVFLDGTNLLDREGRFQIEDVTQTVANRLHLVPRFRQLIHIPQPQLGGPLWVDAPEVDLADHVGVVQLSPPGDEAQLLIAVEQLRRRRLDRSRPLWEMWFLTGLPQRQVALFVRMHHAIADGMAGVATMASFLDGSADAVPARPEPWSPAHAPSESDLREDWQRRQRLHRRKALSTLAHPLRTTRLVLAAWPAIRELLAERPVPATSLDRLVGPGRTFALIRSQLDVIKQVAHTYDATVNDVLLAVIAGGLRGLFRSRRERVEGVLRIYVPVSLHPGQRAEARGNLISQMVVPVPIGVSDPVSRLRHIAAETALRKAKSRPSLGWMPHRGLMGRAFLKLVTRQRVNVTSADIPGPPIPLYFAGARLVEVFPLTQLIGKVSIGIAAMSYAGQFNAMVVADRDAYPDLDVFARSAREELQALTAAASPRPLVAAEAGG